jgi:hypothetical protein
MSFAFSHLLVPYVPDYVPVSSGMVTFLEEAIRSGYLGAGPQLIVRAYPDFDPFDAWFRWGIAGDREAPKTGQTPGPRPTRWVRADQTKQLQQLLQGAGENLQVTAWSETRPKHPPVRGLECIDDGARIPMTDARFDDAYAIAITCHLSEKPRCMSDNGHPDQPSPFGAAVESSGPALAFSPFGDGRYEAKGIGAARFWISLSTAGSVIPSPETFHAHELELAAPALVALAERVFGVDFGQTCVWSA